MVQAFSIVFEDLWHNSTNIEEKLIEMNLASQHQKLWSMQMQKHLKKNTVKLFVMLKKKLF